MEEREEKEGSEEEEAELEGNVRCLLFQWRFCEEVRQQVGKPARCDEETHPHQRNGLNAACSPSLRKISH